MSKKSDLKRPVEPVRPKVYEFGGSKRTRHIYSYYLSTDDLANDEQAHPSPSEITLGWLLKRLPPEVSPDDVKFTVDIDEYQGDEHFVVEGVELKFSYEEETPPRVFEYETAVAKYEKDMIQYKEDMQAYERAVLEADIRRTEETLAKLKERRQCQ